MYVTKKCTISVPIQMCPVFISSKQPCGLLPHAVMNESHHAPKFPNIVATNSF